MPDDVLGALVTGANSLPEPIKRNLIKAAGALIAGAVDVPASFLEMKAAEFKLRKRGRELIMLSAARNAAKMAGKSPELGQRALTFFVNDLVREQANREAVVAEAVQALEAGVAAADMGSGAIDDDWLHQFRRLASSKSNEEVQAILGRILAGEIQKPGSFAPYTLEALARLDQMTAQGFEFAASRALIVPNQWDCLVVSVLTEIGGKMESLLDSAGLFIHLESCGLLTTVGLSQINPEGFATLPPSMLGGERVTFGQCEIANLLNLRYPMKGQVYLLTAAGGQLQSIIPKTFDVAYARKLRDGLRRLGVALAFPDGKIDLDMTSDEK